jgi:hypothetical protein
MAFTAFPLNLTFSLMEKESGDELADRFVRPDRQRFQ